MMFFPRDPVRIAQKLLAADTSEASRLAEVIAAICADGLWESRRRTDGQRFENLTQFVVARAPHGLGVRTDAALRKLRSALLDKGLLKEWVEVMEGAVRSPGHPKANVANSEDLAPVFTRSRSSTSIDRILPRLMRHEPKLFREVEAGRITPHRAAIQAGIIPPPGTSGQLRYGAIDFNALDRVKASARGQLLCQVFDTLGLEAQCALLASRLDGVVGLRIAQIWRERATGETGDRFTKDDHS
jgi:hypothetical protein